MFNVFILAPFILIHENFVHMYCMEDEAKKEENVLIDNYELDEEMMCA
jgi:hypothetical protein